MKKTIIIAGVVAVVLVCGYFYFRHQTKSHSPEDTVVFTDGNGATIKIIYSRPFKKGRTIFGGLEPYGRVWRTGANEATIFETTNDLSIQGRVLKAGTYTLWTIPGEKTWKVLFNTETGQWGVNFNREANRKSKNDVLNVEVPSVTSDTVIEQFTISIEKMEDEVYLTLLWDKTVVSLPMKIISQ